MRNFSRRLTLLSLLVVLPVALNGCSTKDFEMQISQLDTQVAQLRQELAGRDEKIAERDKVASELSKNLADCKAENTLMVEKMGETVMITVPDELAFIPGQMVVSDTMVPTLKAIAATIGEHPGWNVYVEGNTDSGKVSEEWVEYYPTNWELAAYRACAVVRYMTNELALPAENFAAVSYGPFRPVADNATAEGRNKNRVVRFVLHKK